MNNNNSHGIKCKIENIVLRNKIARTGGKLEIIGAVVLKSRPGLEEQQLLIPTAKYRVTTCVENLEMLAFTALWEVSWIHTMFVVLVKAIFSEGFTETLCTGVYFQ